MGHATARITVMKDSRNQQTGSALVSAAIRDWYDNEADRYDDARGGAPKITAVMTEAQENRFFNDNYVTEAWSYVVPKVADESLVKSTKKLKLTVSGAILAAIAHKNSFYGGELWALVLKEFGNEVSGFTVTKVPAPRKAVAVTTEGKRKTDYTVYGIMGKDAVPLSHGFDSQAEARAAAVKTANSDDPKYKRWGAENASFEVRPSMLRESGDVAVVRVARPFPESAVIELQVNFEKIKPNAAVTHYNVYFDYHH